MIFQHTIDAVLSGRKTQTRRVVKDGQKFLPVLEMVIDHGRRKYEVGRTYAVQPGRCKKGVARIRITSIGKERVQEITEQDAMAEGCVAVANLSFGYWTVHTARYAFRDLWDSIQPKGRKWDDNPEVWVINFELVKECENDS